MMTSMLSCRAISAAAARIRASGRLSNKLLSALPLTPREAEMGILTTAMNGQLSRRSFVMSALMAGGSFVIAPRLMGLAEAAEATALNPFIRIPPVGKIELVIAAAEMGQGVNMSLSTLLAEELEVTLD